MFEWLFRWETLWYLLLVLYIPSCIGLIVIVLLQKGKGVGFAGAFGVGAGTDAIFGGRSGKTLPQKLTYVMAGTFMLFALIMSLISGRLGKGSAPEKISEEAVTSAATADVSMLDDLGSGIKGEAAPAAATPIPVTPVAPAPAASEPAKPAPAPPVVPAAESPPAPATPAAP